MESITWWGYHGADSLGPAFDTFVVSLDGVPQSGSLAIDDSNSSFSKYTLTVSPFALSASALSVLNDNPDVEWYWQSAVSNGSGPHATEVAFSLDGNVNVVPEPGTYGLMIMGLLGVGLARRR